MSNGTASATSPPTGPPPRHLCTLEIPPHELRRCYCGGICLLKTAYTWKNFSRMFYGCPNFKAGEKTGCKFFDWEDPLMCGYGRRAVQIFEAMHQEMKMQNDKLEEDNSQLKEENVKLKLKSARAERMMLLVMGVMGFIVLSLLHKV